MELFHQATRVVFSFLRTYVFCSSVACFKENSKCLNYSSWCWKAKIYECVVQTVKSQRKKETTREFISSENSQSMLSTRACMFCLRSCTSIYGQSLHTKFGQPGKLPKEGLEMKPRLLWESIYYIDRLESWTWRQVLKNSDICWYITWWHIYD